MNKTYTYKIPWYRLIKKYKFRKMMKRITPGRHIHFSDELTFTDDFIISAWIDFDGR